MRRARRSRRCLSASRRRLPSPPVPLPFTSHRRPRRRCTRRCPSTSRRCPRPRRPSAAARTRKPARARSAPASAAASPLPPKSDPSVRNAALRLRDAQPVPDSRASRGRSVAVAAVALSPFRFRVVGVSRFQPCLAGPVALPLCRSRPVDLSPRRRRAVAAALQIRRHRAASAFVASRYRGLRRSELLQPMLERRLPPLPLAGAERQSCAIGDPRAQLGAIRTWRHLEKSCGSTKRDRLRPSARFRMLAV